MIAFQAKPGHFQPVVKEPANRVGNLYVFVGRVGWRRRADERRNPRFEEYTVVVDVNAAVVVVTGKHGAHGRRTVVEATLFVAHNLQERIKVPR